MEIPQKPWLYLKTSIDDPKIMSEQTRENLLKKKKIIGLKVFSEEKMYSQLMRRYIQILIFTKFSNKVSLFLKKFEEIVSALNLRNTLYQLSEIKDFFSSSKNTKNIEQVLQYICNPNTSLYLETLSRQLIIYELKSNTYNYSDILQSWVQNDACDIQGELLSVLANALGCQIREYTSLFELKEILYGKNENSDLIISYLRVAEKNYFLMSIEEMESSGFEFTKNDYNLD